MNARNFFERNHLNTHPPQEQALVSGPKPPHMGLPGGDDDDPSCHFPYHPAYIYSYTLSSPGVQFVHFSLHPCETYACPRLNSMSSKE